MQTKNATFGVYRPGEQDPGILVKGTYETHHYFLFLGHPKKGGKMLCKIIPFVPEPGAGSAGLGEGYEVILGAHTDALLLLSAVTMIDDYELACQGKS